MPCTGVSTLGHVLRRLRYLLRSGGFDGNAFVEGVRSRGSTVDRRITCGDGQVLLRVRMVGLRGSNLSTFRGTNPMVSYPRVLGHEVAGTILDRGESLGAISAAAFRGAAVIVVDETQMNFRSPAWLGQSRPSWKARDRS